MNDIIKVVNIIKTCDAFPSQWKAQTIGGDAIYVRFRRGDLSIRIGIGIDEDSAIGGREIFEAEIGKEENDPREPGYMTFEELKEITKGIIEWIGEEVKDA